MTGLTSVQSHSFVRENQVSQCKCVGAAAANGPTMGLCLLSHSVLYGAKTAFSHAFVIGFLGDDRFDSESFKYENKSVCRLRHCKVVGFIGEREGLL